MPVAVFDSSCFLANLGSRLYYMGIKKKEEAKRNVQLRQQEKQNELERSFTYQPKINEMSRYLAVGRMPG